MSRQYQDSFKSRSNHGLAPAFRDMICKKDNLRLALELAGLIGCILYELLANIKRFWRMKEKCVAFLQQRGWAIPSTKDQAEPVGGRGEKLINRESYSWEAWGQIARERAEFPVIFLRQERIRMAGGRGGTATRQRALQLQRRETQNQQEELLNRFTCLSCLLESGQARSKLSSRRSATSLYSIQVSAHALASS